MPSYVLCDTANRSFFTIEQKINVIKRLMDGDDRKEVIADVYGDRPLPKSISMVISNWRRTIQAQLDANNEHVIALCEKAMIIKEGTHTPSKRTNKKAKKAKD